jgi:hypothetical protein
MFQNGNQLFKVTPSVYGNLEENFDTFVPDVKHAQKIYFQNTSTFTIVNLFAIVHYFFQIQKYQYENIQIFSRI